MIITESLIVHSLIDHLSGGFINFVKQMQVPQMIAFDRSMCMKPHQGIWNFAFFSCPTAKGYLVEFWVGMKSGAYLHHIFC